MEELINKFPADHFGKIMDKVLGYVRVGEGVGVYGMPGGGLKYFLRLAKKRLEEDGGTRVVFIECRAEAEGLEEKLRLLLEAGKDEKKTIVILSEIQYLWKKQMGVLSMLLTKRKSLWNHANLGLLASGNGEVMEKEGEYGSFAGVMLGTWLKLPLFDLKGTERMWKINKEYYGFDYPLVLAKRVFELSGGHAGLVKHIGKAVDDWGETALKDEEKLLSYPAVRINLEELTKTVTTSSELILSELGIIDTKGELFSPLLKKYLKNYQNEWVAANMPQLTAQEKKIASFLIANKNRIVDKDQIAFLMGLSEETFSLWAIYKAISRLKKKTIGEYELKTIKGRGYRWESGQK
ncbi:MAG: helix-turn-helix domain-containing protein [Candidatus Shapirobacteria bacterium]